MRSFSRFAKRVGLGAVVAVLASVAGQAVFAPAASAADDPAVSWSVTPADAGGPDGRSWVEQSLDPGETRVEHLAVRNLGASEVTFALSAADGYLTDSGRFNMLPASTPSTGAGLWIELPASVSVPAGGTVVVPFTVAVPDRAVPGDYAAGVAASITSIGSDDGATIGIESRVGFRVLTRVVGELAPALAVADATSDYRVSWNPFTPGRIAVAFAVENTGNTRLSVAGQVDAAGATAAFTPSGEAIELLPGDRREVSVVLDDVWPLLFVPTRIAASVEVADAAGSWEPSPGAAESVSLTTWAPPLPQLAVLLALGLIVVALVARRRRSRRAVADLVEQAREEGRREAWTAPSAPDRVDA
ncbi:hypothetical protein SAMN05428970_0940 [Agromyces sp. CF514]|uniref:hypothetical protein n=1 Tax=Agromyces sp. CF514 TaxID=1881031 RepID=UPI0008E34B75|nr:hypothetical protein [Agromyces sp. CF514]SFR70420.1 hypothetical protein SAMN05428970_0940 [Agromyces sp. CF514]